MNRKLIRKPKKKDYGANKNDRKRGVSELVSLCFEPSQPQRITSRLTGGVSRSVEIIPQSFNPAKKQTRENSTPTGLQAIDPCHTTGKVTSMNGTALDAHAYVMRLRPTGSHGWRQSKLFFALLPRQVIRHCSFSHNRNGGPDRKYHYRRGIVVRWAGIADTRSQQRKRRLENHCGLI